MNKNLIDLLDEVLFTKDLDYSQKLNLYKQIYEHISLHHELTKEYKSSLDNLISTMHTAIASTIVDLDKQLVTSSKFFNKIFLDGVRHNLRTVEDMQKYYDIKYPEMGKHILAIYDCISDFVTGVSSLSYIIGYEKSSKQLIPHFERLKEVLDSNKIPHFDFVQHKLQFRENLLHTHSEIPFDPRLLLDFYNYELVDTEVLFSHNLNLDKQTLVALSEHRDSKQNYSLSNNELIKLYKKYNQKLTANDISAREITIPDFGYYLLFEDIVEKKNGYYRVFETSFSRNPRLESLTDMFFLLEAGFLDINDLPSIYKSAKSIQTDENIDEIFLAYLNLPTLINLKSKNMLTPTVKSFYLGLLGNDNQKRLEHEKSEVENLLESNYGLMQSAQKLSHAITLMKEAFGSPSDSDIQGLVQDLNSTLVSNHEQKLHSALDLLADDLILPESFANYITPEKSPEVIDLSKLPISSLGKLHNCGLLSFNTILHSVPISDIIQAKNDGVIILNSEDVHIDLPTLDNNSVFICYENGLINSEDICEYINNGADIPKSSLPKLYKDKLVTAETLGEKLSEQELIEMHSSGNIGEEFLELLSDSTKESAISSGEISQDTFFKGYEKGIIDLESFVSIEPQGYNPSQYITYSTPAEKIEELFLNDVIPYSTLHTLEKEGIISSDQKSVFVSKYDITPKINSLLQSASIKYNTYKPEHSIDPEELLITLGAEEIIPVTNDFNFAYIPERNVGVLYETTNYSNYIGTSNKTYTLDLLDALEIIGNDTYSTLPNKYPYICATANYGTELLDSIHSIDKSFEYKTNPDLSDCIEDIKIQVIGMDRDED